MAKKDAYLFFQPYVGSNYQHGIQGKRILVIGASFYCDKIHCPYFEQCTAGDTKAYDKICPEYKSRGLCLHDEPSYCVSETPRTYKIFASYLAEALDLNPDYDKVWDKLAFSNYVQHFLPKRSESFRNTLYGDLSETDFMAFKELVVKYMPHIIIVWGTVINSPILHDGGLLVSKDELAETESYIGRIRITGVKHDIKIINPYHPSSSTWFSDFPKFKKYIQTIIHN